MIKYKIEEREPEWTAAPFYVAFVKLWRFGLFSYWAELGRENTKTKAEELCRRHKRPPGQPWLYSADAI